MGLVDAIVLASGNYHVRKKLWSCVKCQGENVGIDSEDGGGGGGGGNEHSELEVPILEM